MGLSLNLSLAELEKVLYYEAFIVTSSATHDQEGGLEVGRILTEQQYIELKEAGAEFEAGMGGEVIKDILKTIDLDLDNKNLRRELKAATTEATRVKKLLKGVIESMLKSDNRPDWFMMDIILVLPPDLRPLVPLEAGRFATSDLNDLYRRVINRNNRLRRLKNLTP